MPEFVKVAKTNDIPCGQAKMIEVNGNKTAHFIIGGSFYAMDTTCAHVGGSLSEGRTGWRPRHLSLARSSL